MAQLQVRLGERDRAELGCEEWLDLDYLDITVAELEEVCERTGIDADDWPQCLQARVAFEDVDKPDPPKRSPRWRAHVTVWLALHQNGHSVSWQDAGNLRVSRIGMRVLEDPKDEAAPEPSEPEPSESPTSLSSPTSSPG